jgi:hypothetical protein
MPALAPVMRTVLPSRREELKTDMGRDWDELQQGALGIKGRRERLELVTRTRAGDGMPCPARRWRTTWRVAEIYLAWCIQLYITPSALAGLGRWQ